MEKLVGVNLVLLQGNVAWITRYGDFARLSLNVRDLSGREGTISVVLHGRQMREVERRCPGGVKGAWLSVTGRLEAHLEHGKRRIDVIATRVEVIDGIETPAVAGGGCPGDRGPGAAWRGL